MKLLTHNFLQCHVKGVKSGYPLKIEAAKIEQRDADYDPGKGRPDSAAVSSSSSSTQQQLLTSDAAAQAGLSSEQPSRHTLVLSADFLRTMYKRIDWKAFVEGAQAVSAHRHSCTDKQQHNITRDKVDKKWFICWVTIFSAG